MTQRIQELLGKAIQPSAVRVVGAYTLPHTWGVYEVELNGVSVRRFRKGNHPIRHIELEKEFGKAQILGLFTIEEQAIELAKLLNDDDKS